MQQDAWIDVLREADRRENTHEDGHLNSGGVTEEAKNKKRFWPARGRVLHSVCSWLRLTVIKQRKSQYCPRLNR